MTSHKHRDVIIVGGGICGAMTAYYLRLEGVSVALLDKGRVGQEASWASAGMVGPESCPQRDPWFLGATTLSKRLYDDLIDELSERTGQRIDYGGGGHLLVAREEAELEHLHERVAAQSEADVGAQVLDGMEARAREPALPDDVVAAAWLPTGRFLDARQFTAVVAAASRQLGADIHEGWQVSSLVWDGNGKTVMGVRSGHDEMHADIVINAAGAWAGHLDARLTHPVIPLHGQIMSVSAPPGGLRHNVARVGKWGYATPRSDGRVVVGATHEQWGYQKKITPTGLAYLSAVVNRVLPCLTNRPILDVWSGLRPVTIDGLPTVGPDPRVNSGYLWAAGHASSGIMQTPATARVVTDLVLGRQPTLPIDQLSVERYLNNTDLAVVEPLMKLEQRFLSV